MGKYNLRINPRSGEIHIFRDGEEKSICGKVSTERTEALSVVRHSADGDKILKELVSLPAEGTRDVVEAFSNIGLELCGTCVSSLHRTIKNQNG